jgi:N-acetylneuraminic acid mutarotase
MKNCSRSRSGSARALLALVLFTASGCVVVNADSFGPEATNTASQRTLTFADRVAYQRAVEEVYWLHRIWPKENPVPKPSLDEVMSQQQIQQKVEEYLRNSQLLAAQWQRPITPEQLQAEIDRMASHTRQPEVLRDLFAALGNDPLVIAECLARPILSERLENELHAGANPRAEPDSLRSSAARTETQSSVTTEQPTSDYYLPEITSSSVEDAADGCVDHWTATSTTGAPDQRALHTAVWTGTEMIVWGGINGSGILKTGGRYNPSTDSWVATNTNNAPSARWGHTAVWTGTEMIIWGGGSNTSILKTGGRYNPSTDSWIATTTTGAPFARRVHTAVWTGTEMIVWGGFGAHGHENTGRRYNPNTDRWVAMTTTGAPTGRSGNAAVWTGTEMIVWGGGTDIEPNGVNTGGRYNPTTNSWVATTTNNAPDARFGHAAVWTGTEMIVWGGYDNQHPPPKNTGGRYNPSTDSWVATTINNAPEGAFDHTAVWSGTEMIVWGGYGGLPFLNTGGRYNPNTDSWVATTTNGAPAGRSIHTAVWTGTEMIVWGGYNNGNPGNGGGRYVPCTVN